MRRFLSALALISLGYSGMAPRAHADVSFSLSIGDTDGYYMGLSNYYGIPQDRVTFLVRRGLSYDEVTVALHIAEVAGVDPYEVADLRLSGMPWIEVAHYYGLGADIFYVSDEDPIGPYVTYYEPFRTHPRSYWPSLMLSDVAIVNLANLRYECQHYGVPARQVMRYRARGESFLKVNRDLFRERGRIPSRPMARRAIRAQALPQQLRLEARNRWKDMPDRQRMQRRPGSRLEPMQKGNEDRRLQPVPRQQMDRKRKADKRQQPVQQPSQQQLDRTRKANRRPQPKQAPPATKIERTRKLNQRQRVKQAPPPRQQMQHMRQLDARQMQPTRTQQTQRVRQVNERQRMHQAQPQRAQAPRANARGKQMSGQTSRPRAAGKVSGRRHQN